MYSSTRRETLREELLRLAREDQRISAAAVTGSAASERQDKWSDIDLAFAVTDSATTQEVLADWTTKMYASGAVHHFDVKAGAWIYRVFLLADTLQVDLAFVPSIEFRPLGPNFRLIFGQAGELRPFPFQLPDDVIGMGWLYALHARSCIARGRFWQAEHMISAVRDHTFTLACLRNQLPAAHARGVDSLPEAVCKPLEGSLIRNLEPEELWRAFASVIDGYMREVERAAPALALRLEGPLRQLVRGANPDT